MPSQLALTLDLTTIFAHAQVHAAIAASGQPKLQRRLHALTHGLFSEYFPFLMWGLWVAIGIIWGMWHQGWDLLTAFYAALSALTTSGLQAPALNTKGKLPLPSSLFLVLRWILALTLTFAPGVHPSPGMCRHHRRSSSQRTVSLAYQLWGSLLADPQGFLSNVASRRRRAFGSLRKLAD